MNNLEFANLLFPDVKHDIAYYEEKYPPRNLPETALVTRSAPSPTGFLHLGTVYNFFVNQKFARQTKDSVFYIRIEDTDKKREVENGVASLMHDISFFDIKINEGVIGQDKEIGNYGPYTQSKRGEIYRTFAKYLVTQGLAYPCFCSEESLTNDHNVQIAAKERQGYYGKWAHCRNISIDDAAERIKNGEKYIVRLKSPGNYSRKIKHKDLIRGETEFPEHDIDIPIIKSDNLPTYHFAHLVDDHLMRTTHVIRGEEWYPSMPLHIQLFNLFGFKPPKYAHVPCLSKEENGSKRKLSKRKDPEAAVSYYHEKGIPTDTILLYIANLLNSNFEDWYNKEFKEKGQVNVNDFMLDFKKIGTSSMLFDLEKLTNIAKNYISTLTTDEVFNKTLAHAKIYNSSFATILEKDIAYSKKILGIERGGVKPRKDIAAFGEVEESCWYMFDELFNARELNYQFQNISDKNEIEKIVSTYLEKYFDGNDDKDTWFEKIKKLSEEFGYAREVKEYKNNPSAFKGHVGDISTVLRVVFTTQNQTPDLYEITKLLGKQRLSERANKAKL